MAFKWGCQIVEPNFGESCAPRNMGDVMHRKYSRRCHPAMYPADPRKEWRNAWRHIFCSDSDRMRLEWERFVRNGDIKSSAWFEQTESLSHRCEWIIYMVQDLDQECRVVIRAGKIRVLCRRNNVIDICRCSDKFAGGIDIARIDVDERQVLTETDQLDCIATYASAKVYEPIPAQRGQIREQRKARRDIHAIGRCRGSKDESMIRCFID